MEDEEEMDEDYNISGVLEYLSIDSPLISGYKMLSDFSGLLSKEFSCATEADAFETMEAEMLLFLRDNDVLLELKRDCSVDNLYIEGEHRTVDEILQLIPIRTPDCGELRTLNALPNCSSEKMSSRHTLTIRNRLQRPQVDMSYLNSPDDYATYLPAGPDVIFSVFIYRPVAGTVDCSNTPWKLIMDQKIEILGSQNLSALRDVIRCPQDKVWLGDCSETLDDQGLHICGDSVYTSAYFFIENTFFDDLRNSKSTALSECMVQWQNNRIDVDRNNLFSSLTTDVKIGDLQIYCGKPYLFLHQGNCEHAIIFTDARLTDRTSARSPSSYPMCTGRSYTLVSKCESCKKLATQWLAYEALDLLPKNPTPLCNRCLRYLLYTEDGKKIYPEFRIKKYIGQGSVR